MADSLDLTYGDATQSLAVTDGTIRAADLKKIQTPDGPLATYDPGLLNTASVRSAITYIDGDAGILRYRGYPIEQLAEKSTFLETAYLVLYGELPTPDQLTWFTDRIRDLIADFIRMPFRYGLGGKQI